LAELDVDFIGGQNPMTKEEENSISEFIKAQKLRNSKPGQTESVRQHSSITRCIL